jgi:hypothetical protein
MFLLNGTDAPDKIGLKQVRSGMPDSVEGVEG